MLCVDKSIALANAVKLAVPVTLATPVCVIAPPVVTDKLPLFVKAGNANAALSNWKVKSRKLVKLAKLVGAATVA